VLFASLLSFARHPSRCSLMCSYRPTHCVLHCCLFCTPFFLCVFPRPLVRLESAACSWCLMLCVSSVFQGRAVLLLLVFRSCLNRFFGGPASWRLAVSHDVCSLLCAYVYRFCGSSLFVEISYACGPG